jgi:hypothetical protein
MSRLLVVIASISVAFLAISSTCLASPAAWGPAASGGPTAASGEAMATAWPASVVPSRLIGGGLLSL